jgi:hypothetical protein
MTEEYICKCGFGTTIREGFSHLQEYDPGIHGD